MLLLLELAGLQTHIERCIVGAVRCHERASLSAHDSLIDATARSGVALAALDGSGPGAALTLEACTVVGKLHAAQMSVSNSILLAALAEGDSWAVPVRAARKQVGCVRFSWLPLSAIVPTRFRCQPGSASDAQHIAPRFTSLVYGTPAYAQLTRSTPPEVLRGADDEIFEITKRVFAQHISLVARNVPTNRCLARKHVKVILPKINHYLLQLPFGVDRTKHTV